MEEKKRKGNKIQTCDVQFWSTSPQRFWSTSLLDFGRSSQEMLEFARRWLNFSFSTRIWKRFTEG